MKVPFNLLSKSAQIKQLIEEITVLEKKKVDALANNQYEIAGELREECQIARNDLFQRLDIEYTIEYIDEREVRFYKM